ncbi:Aste57867_14740 [Aphanomyces stellatus]|uniref:Aste57867_14740 protein n=1 Tax=Aphanomyces stellatus TaxID=120398 RepID=A0A485L209_9STRA|nr:hypothetical protein As57867_014685 [Aphanomyces stellatus]VFT91558.1 Aste57867_14740 [Aphanomyces stellatus]
MWGLDSLLAASAMDLAGRAALAYLAVHAIRTLLEWSDSSNAPARGKEHSFDPHEAPAHRHYRFNADRTLWLHTQWWLPRTDVEWKGIIFISHGYNEHIERYHFVATTLADRGFAVLGMTHQGMGLSEGDRLYVEHFSHYENDLVAFIRDTLALTSESAHAKEALMRLPDGLALSSLPRFLLSHSMGALVSLQVIHNHPDIKWTGAIMSSGAFQIDPKMISPLEQKAAAVLSAIFPKFRPPNPDIPNILRDPREHERALRDSLNFKTGPPARWISEFIAAQVRAPAMFPNIKTPLLIFHGEKDGVTPPAGSAALFAGAASPSKEMHLVPNMFHELLHDTCRDSMVDQMVAWAARISNEQA